MKKNKIKKEAAALSLNEMKRVKDIMYHIFRFARNCRHFDEYTKYEDKDEKAKREAAH